MEDLKLAGDQLLNLIEEVPSVKQNHCFCLHKNIRKRKLHNLLSRRLSERIVFKSGQFNFEKSSSSKFHVFPDIVTTFIEARWRWTLTYCFLTYIFIWLIFSAVWWIILYIHGDLELEHLPDNVPNQWKPCVRQIYGFTSIFLFSIEIQTTLGYGTRSVTLECPEAIFIMCIEGILGTIIQSFIVGIVFAKLTRPKNRAQTLIFSKNAIIIQRDRNLCFIFRVGNIRKSRILGASVNAYLIRCVTDEGDLLKNEQIKLDLTVDSTENISFMLPISAVHKIDNNSPFYSMSAYDLIKSNVEVLVVFEGTIESTGQPVQIKSSYINQDILWGNRFRELVEYRKDKQGYVIDYKKFDETIRINTPLCSAKELHNFNKESSYYK